MVAVAAVMLFATTAMASQADDEIAIRAQADAYATLFAKADAAKLALLWAVDGTFIDSEGREFKSREKIQQLFQAYFKSYSGQTLKFSIHSLRFPAPNVAVEEGTSTLFEQDLPVSKARYLVVHVKNNGVWEMSSVTETSARPASTSLNDLDWLIGEWTAKGPRGSVALQTTWIANQHLLKAESKDKEGEFQLIGWDPATKGIVSWHFDGNGGFGWGSWYQIGDTWVEKAQGVAADGKIVHATYVLHKLGDDRFTWHSVNRTMNGQSVPDLPPVEVSRNK
jgi:uncharacterized protein (TIGR02246 family)